MYDAAPQLDICGAGDQIRGNQDDRRCAEDEDGDSNQRGGHGSNDHGAMRRPQKLIHYVHPMIIRASNDIGMPISNPLPIPSLMLWAIADGVSFRASARTVGISDARVAR
jgi:hypothetical protein